MKHLPKTLLVTLTPPGGRNVGEVILNDLCRLLPPEKLVICSVAPAPAVVDEFDHVHIQAPSDLPWRPFSGRLGGLCNAIHVRCVYASKVKKLTNEIIDVARRNSVEQIWLTLNSLPLIAIGAEVSNSLGLPLLSLVWDPPDWAARGKGWDRASRKWLLKKFGLALQSSERVMVVSQGMVDEYQRNYQTPCFIVRHAIRGAGSTALPDKQVCRIGFAGTLYDPQQLNLLLQALNTCHWRIGGREVSLRMIGNYYRFTGLTEPARIELLGWRTPEETRELLSECDITYLPVSFHEEWADFARLSFPTKLSTYLAAGRPVLVHGPEYSSSVQFCRENGFGLSCASMDIVEMSIALSSLLGDDDVYRKLLEGVDETLNRSFTPALMKSQFAKFLGVDESVLPGSKKT